MSRERDGEISHVVGGGKSGDCNGGFRRLDSRSDCHCDSHLLNPLNSQVFRFLFLLLSALPSLLSLATLSLSASFLVQLLRSGLVSPQSQRPGGSILSTHALPFHSFHLYTQSSLWTSVNSLIGPHHYVLLSPEA